MRHGKLAGLGGIAFGAMFGAALGAGPGAAADAIDDAWPYGGTGSPYTSLHLPGFPEAGSGTNGGRDVFGPFTHTYGDYIATHTDDGTDEWYTAHSDTYVIPDFYTEERTEVTGLLDGSATFPSAGTVFDTTDLFPINSPIGVLNPFENSYVNDPELGFADQFTLNLFFIAGSNTFLSDAAGIKDVINVDGQQFTVFDLPYTAGAEPGFADLLAELTGAASAATDLF